MAAAPIPRGQARRGTSRSVRYAGEVQRTARTEARATRPADSPNYTRQRGNFSKRKFVPG